MNQKQLIDKLNDVYMKIEGLEETELKNLERTNRKNYEALGEIIQELEDDPLEPNEIKE